MGAHIAHTAGTSRQSCLHVVGSHVVRTGSQRTGSQDVRQPRQLQLVRQPPPLHRPPLVVHLPGMGYGGLHARKAGV